MQERLKEVFNKLCELDEIKVNNPLDFKQYKDGFIDIAKKYYRPHVLLQIEKLDDMKYIWVEIKWS